MIRRKIPLFRPSITQKEIKNVVKTLKSGWLAHGPISEKLAEKICKFLKVKYCVLMNSGASALFTDFSSLEDKREVILPSFTFSASANSVVLASHKPVFCEIDRQTGNLDPKKLEEKITKKTVAIMPVHFAGQSCKMDKIMAISRKNKLKVIEDSAECFF